jgi:hypothetical protein
VRDDPDAAGGDLDWVSSLLWRGNLRAVRGSTPPAGHRPVERYLVLPAATRARALVPLGAPRAAAAAVSSYPGLRPARRRAARGALGLSARTGTLGLVARDRLTVCAPDGAEPAGPDPDSLVAHLRDLLGEPELVVGVALGTPGPNRKPVLQAATPDGRVLGFVKIGWNAITAEQVAAEAVALADYTTRPGETFDVPRLLAEGTWRDLRLSVASSLPADVRRHAQPALAPPTRITREIAGRDGVTESPLLASPYWRRLTRRVDEVAAGDDRTGDVLAAYLGRVEERHGGAPLRWGAWHGDWAPWNVGWSTGRLQVWDWEHTRGDVPLGLDLLHWFFQVAFVLERADVGAAIGSCGQRAAAGLRELGVDARADVAMAALYLTEIVLRFAEALRAGAGRNPRFFPAALDVLEARP